MTDYSEYFHPELEAILREIARDPKAKLLAVPTSGQLVHAMREPSVGIAAPGLVSAERELLEVYREEVGELLKQRCLIQFFQMPDADLRWHKSVRAGEVLEVRDEAEWRAETARTLGSGLSGERTRVGEDLLERCVSGDSERPVSITQLAKAMQRVAGLEQADVYIAFDLYAEERYSEAIAVSKKIALSSPSPLILSASLEVAGTSYSATGLPDRALDAFQESLGSMSTRISPAMNGLCLSIEFGLENRALQFAEILNDHAEMDDPGLKSFVDGADARAQRAGLSLSAASRALITRMCLDSSSPAARVCGAFDE